MALIEDVRCVAPCRSRCGEGVVWHEAHQAVYFTDINAFLINRFDTRAGTLKSWFFDEPVTAMILTGEDDTLAVSIGSRVILWQPENDKRQDHSFRLKDWPKVRLNEGRADPRGSLWLGSMRNNVNPDGSSGEAGGKDGVLYRVDPNGTVTEWKSQIGIANTLAWNPERTRLYFADTLANIVWVYDYDADNGKISGERPFLVDFPRGLPDGSSMDSEGYLWNCRHGGGCIVRVAPNGTIDQVIDMPTTNITTCTFGGADLRTLYVTTAASGSPETERFAGGLFALRTGAKGQPENRFRAFGG